MLMQFYGDVSHEEIEIEVRPTGVVNGHYFVTITNDIRLVLATEQLETLVERVQQELTNADVEKQQLDHYKEETE